MDQDVFHLLTDVVFALVYLSFVLIGKGRGTSIMGKVIGLGGLRVPEWEEWIVVVRQHVMRHGKLLPGGKVDVQCRYQLNMVQTIVQAVKS